MLDGLIFITDFNKNPPSKNTKEEKYYALKTSFQTQPLRGEVFSLWSSEFLIYARSNLIPPI